MNSLLLFLSLLSLASAALSAECSFVSQKELGQEIWEEINREPYTCQKNNVHLTFDDGPSLTVTPGILKELKDGASKQVFLSPQQILIP